MDNALLPEEKLIVVSNDKKVLLTNMRFIISDKSYYSSMQLEEISSVEVGYYADVKYLVVGVFSIFCIEQLFLNVKNNTTFLLIQLFSCLGIVLIWYFFHRSIISLHSKNGKKISVLVNKKAFGKTAHFIHQIEQAKNERILTLSCKRST